MNSESGPCFRHRRVPGFRHLAREASQWDGAPPFPRFCGGALLLTRRLFAAANGYSNGYWGWGGEDDDFCLRLMREVCTGAQPSRGMSASSGVELGCGGGEGGSKCRCVNL